MKMSIGIDPKEAKMILSRVAAKIGNGDGPAQSWDLPHAYELHHRELANAFGGPEVRLVVNFGEECQILVIGEKRVETLIINSSAYCPCMIRDDGGKNIPCLGTTDWMRVISNIRSQAIV